MKIFLNLFTFILDCASYVREDLLIEVHYFVVLHLVFATITRRHLVGGVHVSHIALTQVI